MSPEQERYVDLAPEVSQNDDEALSESLLLDAGSYLVDEMCKCPVIVYNHPKELRPFYARLRDDGRTVSSFDVIMPKVRREREREGELGTAPAAPLMATTRPQLVFSLISSSGRGAGQRMPEGRAPRRPRREVSRAIPPWILTPSGRRETERDRLDLRRSDPDLEKALTVRKIEMLRARDRLNLDLRKSDLDLEKAYNFRIGDRRGKLISDFVSLSLSPPLSRSICRMEALGLAREQYGWYLELRQHGTVRHSGFGMAFEGMAMLATGVDDASDVIPFPRAFGKTTTP